MTFQFHISLKDISPAIWRRLIVPGEYNFYQLHLAIQEAFGWENSHLFQFGMTGLSDKEGIGIPDPEDNMIVHDANDILVRAVFKKLGTEYTYIYDFGDHWQHLILLEAIGIKKSARVACLDGENECPPEDVGGPRGYQAFVECFVSGSAKEKKEFRQWLGLKPAENWDPTYFSIRQANRRLSKLE